MAIPLVDRTRRNHALEHATIAVLLDGGTRTPLAGNSTPGGFFIYGRVLTEEVTSAASEALRRLREGQRELAVSPFCGTNLVVGGLLAGLLVGIIMRRPRGQLRRLPLAAAAVVASVIAGRPLGKIVQERYTTLADVGALEIASVRGFTVGGYMVHWVGTRTNSA